MSPGCVVSALAIEGSRGTRGTPTYHVANFGRAPGKEEEDAAAPKLCVLVGGDAGGALALFDDDALLDDWGRDWAGDGDGRKG